VAEQEFDVKGSQVLGLDGEVKQVSILITRKPNDAPDDTTWGVARQIMAIPEEGIDGLTKEEAIEAVVKRYGHHEKLGVYLKIDRYLREDGSNVKWVRESLIAPKIETHNGFAHRPLNEQVYGRGNWKK